MGVGNILRRSAFNNANKTALVFENQRMNYGELNQRVNCLANSLLQMGLLKGDRVAVLLHNCPEFFEIYFACARSGAIFVPINNLLRQGEFRQILEYIEPRFVFFDADFTDVIQAGSRGMGCIEFPIILHGEQADYRQFDGLIAGGGEAEPEVFITGDDIVNIFLTSGTTGRPKGALRNHRHDVLNMMTSAIEQGIRRDDRALLLFPFYHVTFADSLRHILMANTIVIRREGGFNAEEVLGLLSAERITTCQFVPTTINAMLQAKNLERYDLRHLRLISYAASPMPVELLKKAMRRFNCEFLQMYGQTETGPCTTALKPEDHVTEGSDAQIARLASAGRAVLDYEIRIVDPYGNDVAAGDIGEIIVRSEAMAVGYWNLPEETNQTIKDGWLYTGDFGRMDDEGYVFIVDRKNDLIISGGKNIYPREIEEVIYTHKAVLEVAVIGVPDDYWGESVKAYVVLKGGMNATEEEIIDLCKKAIASYKKPRSVEFVQQLPKSPTGKILKRVIKDQYRRGKVD
ncbi:MAG: long-chain-fatty-acid--CoA ligase [Desulfobacterales bacterium]|jgi:acyl-CoA synthetase (AMP-forming)/AMP-acid ligase II